MKDADAGTAAPARDERGQLLIDLSNAVVRIHKRHYGKGPTKARSQLGHDFVAVVLEGGYTRVEQTLLDYGHDGEVARTRMTMQAAVEQDFRVAVEQILQRTVRSFMSANDPARGLQVEIFILEPRAAAQDGDGRELSPSEPGPPLSGS